MMGRNEPSSRWCVLTPLEHRTVFFSSSLSLLVLHFVSMTAANKGLRHRIRPFLTKMLPHSRLWRDFCSKKLYRKRERKEKQCLLSKKYYNFLLDRYSKQDSCLDIRYKLLNREWFQLFLNCCIIIIFLQKFWNLTYHKILKISAWSNDDENIYKIIYFHKLPFFRFLRTIHIKDLMCIVRRNKLFCKFYKRKKTFVFGET